jgi:hypothetical protein
MLSRVQAIRGRLLWPEQWQVIYKLPWTEVNRNRTSAGAGEYPIGAGCQGNGNLPRAHPALGQG